MQAALATGFVFMPPSIDFIDIVSQENHDPACQECLYSFDMELNNVIAAWVKEARLRGGYNQEQLGEQLGVTKANVSAWENSRHEPSISQLLKIAGLCKAALPNEFCEQMGLTSEAMEVAHQYQELSQSKRMEVRSIVSTYAMAARAEASQAAG